MSSETAAEIEKLRVLARAHRAKAEAYERQASTLQEDTTHG